jgi:hypothetical protein
MKKSNKTTKFFIKKDYLSFCSAFAPPLLRLCSAFAPPLLRLCSAFAPKEKEKEKEK